MLNLFQKYVELSDIQEYSLVYANISVYFQVTNIDID